MRCAVRYIRRVVLAGLVTGIATAGQAQTALEDRPGRWIAVPLPSAPDPALVPRTAPSGQFLPVGPAPDTGFEPHRSEPAEIVILPDPVRLSLPAPGSVGQSSAIRPQPRPARNVEVAAQAQDPLAAAAENPPAPDAVATAPQLASDATGAEVSANFSALPPELPEPGQRAALPALNALALAPSQADAEPIPASPDALGMAQALARNLAPEASLRVRQPGAMDLPSVDISYGPELIVVRPARPARPEAVATDMPTPVRVVAAPLLEPGTVPVPEPVATSVAAPEPMPMPAIAPQAVTEPPILATAPGGVGEFARVGVLPAPLQRAPLRLAAARLGDAAAPEMAPEISTEIAQSYRPAQLHDAPVAPVVQMTLTRLRMPPDLAAPAGLAPGPTAARAAATPTVPMVPPPPWAGNAPLSPHNPTLMPRADPTAVARLISDAEICWRLAPLSPEAGWARVRIGVALDAWNMPAESSIALIEVARVNPEAGAEAFAVITDALVACAEASARPAATRRVVLEFDRYGVRQR